MKSKIAINGRIFEFAPTGVGRFCIEVIKEIDKMECAHLFVLLVPCDAKNIPDLKKIRVRTIGITKGIMWEQITFPLYARKHGLKTLNMSNSIPIIKPDYVVIHDISLKVNKPEITSIKEKAKIWWPLLHYWIASKRALRIFTVSEFQKKEIIREYGIENRKIIVVYNGWQHMNRIREDDTILDKFNLKKETYFFALSTRAKNKNFKWVLEVAKKHPEDMFVISGKMDTKYFSDEIRYDKIENIKSTGYVTDEEMKALMKKCKALLYPSIYEGFGIPPLEALSVGTTVIVSNSSCLPEIFGDTVHYIDPFETNINLNELLRESLELPNEVLSKYSWKKTAVRIIKGIYR